MPHELFEQFYAACVSHCPWDLLSDKFEWLATAQKAFQAAGSARHKPGAKWRNRFV
jgi:hypothetical protein